MTEAEARAALRAYAGVGGLEGWLSLQPWRPAPDGWTITRDLEGWRFRLTQVSGGLRVSAAAPNRGTPAVWLVKE